MPLSRGPAVCLGCHLWMAQASDLVAVCLKLERLLQSVLSSPARTAVSRAALAHVRQAALEQRGVKCGADGWPGGLQQWGFAHHLYPAGSLSVLPDF